MTNSLGRMDGYILGANVQVGLTFKCNYSNPNPTQLCPSDQTGQMPARSAPPPSKSFKVSGRILGGTFRAFSRNAKLDRFLIPAPHSLIKEWAVLKGNPCSNHIGRLDGPDKDFEA